jgi:raffinose/stachyose/melibiose transport system permease protein
MALFRYTWRAFAREIAVMLLAVAFCVPLYIMVVISLKDRLAAYDSPLKLPSDPKFSNYESVWSQGGRVNLSDALLNSFIITSATVLLLVVFGSTCAYVLARRPSNLGTGLYILFVIGIILPFQLAVIPVFAVFREFELTGSRLGAILLYTGLFMPFAVFLYTGFIRALPKDYEEAAQVDGAGLMRTYFRVVLPLLGPVTGTVALLAGLFIWNDFFAGLVFLSGSDAQTLPVALYALVGEYVSQWDLIMAGVAISIAPILAFYLFAQRHLMRGVASGIKG